jgi:hypothetical protein
VRGKYKLALTLPKYLDWHVKGELGHQSAALLISLARPLFLLPSVAFPHKTFLAPQASAAHARQSVVQLTYSALLHF